MSRDTDVARLTHVLGAPGFRYRNFTNAAVRPIVPAAASLPSPGTSRTDAPAPAMPKLAEASAQPSIGNVPAAPRIRAVPAPAPRPGSSPAARFTLLEALLAADAVPAAVPATAAPRRPPAGPPPRDNWAAALRSLAPDQAADHVATTPLAELLRRAAGAPGR